MRIYDVIGQEVATLLNEVRPAGSYAVTWNAAWMPTGIYFYRIESPEFTQTKKMIYVK